MRIVRALHEAKESPRLLKVTGNNAVYKPVAYDMLFREEATVRKGLILVKELLKGSARPSAFVGLADVVKCHVSIAHKGQNWAVRQRSTESVAKCCSVVIFLWILFSYRCVYGCMFCIHLLNSVSYVFLLLCMFYPVYSVFIVHSPTTLTEVFPVLFLQL